MNATSPVLSFLLVAALSLPALSPVSAAAQRRDDERSPKTTKPKGPEDDPRIGQPTPPGPRGPVIHMRHDPDPITDPRPARPEQPPQRETVQPPPQRHVEPAPRRVEPAPARVEPARPARVVKKAPPRPRRVKQPRRPSHDAVWIEGHWQWKGGRYVWTNGRWDRARRDQIWTQPTWERVKGGWIFVEGRWEPERPRPTRIGPDRRRTVTVATPSNEAEIIRACGDATVGNTALQSCVERARPLGGHAPRVIQACGAQTVGNGALLDCLDAIGTIGPRTGDAVVACGRATTGNGALAQCVGIATRTPRNPLPVIDACSDATVGNGAFIACIDGSLR
jgi:hypothetical protein